MQTRFTSIFTRAAMTLLMVLLTTVTAWAQDPASIGSIQYNSTLGAYEINSVQNLNDLAVYVNGRGTYSTSGDETTAHSCSGLTFKQTADITYTGTGNYTPIGLRVNDDGFQGTFDGQGNTISGIDCTGDGLTGEEESLGLFGRNRGTVRNVTLSGCRFASANNENYDDDNYAIYVGIGSIAGENDETGTISNCTVTGGTVSRTRTANANYFETPIGGIAGENYGSITDCTYSGSVTGTYSGSNINMDCTFHIGGIAGSSGTGGSITGCGSDAAVSCSAPNVSAPRLCVGGIAGLNNGAHGTIATVSDCFFSGTLSGTGKTGGNTSYIYIGALVGCSINSSIVTNNYYYGDYTSTIGSEDSAASHENLVRVYQLTGNSITATAPEGSGTTFKGVSYFKAAATVTLAPQAGYAITAASYDDGSENHEITPDNGVYPFTMPANDVTVTATTIQISGICGHTNVNNGKNVIWRYNLETKTLTISGTGAMNNYSGNSQPWAAFKSDITTAVIEEGVTSISNRFLYGCTALTSVTIGSSVTTIGASAFNGCTALTSVTIGSSVTTIGASAFYGCTSLATISGAAGVTTIESSAFDDTAWYNGLPDGLTTVGHVAYRFKGDGTSVTLPDGTTQIYNGAFGNTAITSIIIPASVTSIGDRALASSALRKVYCLASEPPALSAYSFDESLPAIVVPTAAYELYKKRWYSYSDYLQPGYTVSCGEGITATSFAPIVAEDETVTLGYTGDVPVDKSVRYSYNDGSEDHDVSGKTFEMPGSNVTVTATLSAKPTNTDAITYVDADDRRKTKAAGDVYILDGLEGTLGQDDADTWYVVNSNVTYTTGLTLNGNVHLILADGKTMTVTNTSGTGISGTGNFAIYARDFESYNYGSLVVTGSTHGICCSGNVTINGGKVEAVSTGSTADGCYGIKANGDITLGWTSLNDNITASSYSGNTVRIADGWTLTYSTKIGTQNVTNCCSGTLSTDEIAAIAGKTLTPLTVLKCSGSVAWDDNDNRYDIRPDAVTLHLYKNGDNNEIATANAAASDGWRFSIGEGNYPSFVTNDDIKTPEVYTIEEEVDGYSADISFSYYGFTITNTLVTSGTCGKTANDNVTWEVTDTDGDDTYDKLTISGTGRMANYSSSNQPWAAFKSDITTAVIEDGVTIIGSDAFNGCTLLSTVTFTGTPQLTAIYDAAFYGCTALTAIDIPASVTTLERGAFQYCTNLATVSGGDGLTSIGANVFYDTAWKNNLANNLSDGLFYLGHVAFLMKGNATDITLAEGTTQIYDDAFYHCTTLTTIIIPASVESIGEDAFANCENLGRVYVLRTTPITTLGFGAFNGCDPYLVIVVPADADYINHSLNGYWQNYNLQSGYTVTCDTGITFTTTNKGPLVETGETVTLSGTGTAPAGYTTPFIGYSVKDKDGDPIDMATDNTFAMPSSVTVTATWTTIPWTGSGDTADDPYIIEYPSQLDLLATNVNAGNEYSGKYFELANDITYAHTTAWNDANSKENNYTAIGYYDNTSPGYFFKGTFDGNNKTISGIRIYKAGTGFTDECQGVFGQLGSEGTVKNLVLANSHIAGLLNIGGIVGYSLGTIENCNCLESVTISPNHSNRYRFGGIAGLVSGGSISNCTSSATIRIGTNAINCSYFGGIVGSVSGGSISNCISSATIINKANGCSYFGGVTGGDSNGSSLTGNLVINASFSDKTSPGAILGGDYVYGTLKNNYYSGCTVNDNPMAYNVGYNGGDITDNDGAVPAVILSETQTAMPTLAENTKVVFRREFKENVSSTVCLPFEINATQAAAAGKFYTFVGVDKTDPDNWEVIMQETPTSNLVEGALAANTPYLFKPKATGPVLFCGEAAASSTAGEASDTEGWKFKGTYARKQWDDTHNTDEIGSIYGFAATNATTISPGTFFRVKGGSNSYILPFRAYLDAANCSSSAPRRTSASELPAQMKIRLIAADGGTTEIKTTDFTDYTDKAGAWYDLSGRKLSQKPTQKGVYIHGDRKVVIK